MFRIGLLLVLLIAVSARFELEDEVLKNLPYFKALSNKAPTLAVSILKDRETAVLWKRVVKPETDGEIVFLVDAVNTDKSDHPVLDQTVHSGEPCGRSPWIRVTLQKTKRNFLRHFCIPPRRVTEVYCLHGMHIKIIKRETQPQVRLVVTFKDPWKKETIGVKMDVFKPPKHQTDSLYSRASVQVDSPIPLGEFEKPSLKSSEYERQYFVSNIMWIETVLPRARYLRRTTENQKNAQWYTAGPIIVQPKEFDNILGLEKDFERFNSEREKSFFEG